MKTHILKSWPHLFKDIKDGIKHHELRRHDRPFEVLDILVLREFVPGTQEYTGREIKRRISYITSVDNPCALSNVGLMPGFCILSIEEP